MQGRICFDMHNKRRLSPYYLSWVVVDSAVSPANSRSGTSLSKETTTPKRCANELSQRVGGDSTWETDRPPASMARVAGITRWFHFCPHIRYRPPVQSSDSGPVALAATLGRWTCACSSSDSGKMRYSTLSRPEERRQRGYSRLVPDVGRSMNQMRVTYAYAEWWCEERRIIHAGLTGILKERERKVTSRLIQCILIKQERHGIFQSSATPLRALTAHGEKKTANCIARPPSRG